MRETAPELERDVEGPSRFGQSTPLSRPPNNGPSRPKQHRTIHVWAMLHDRLQRLVRCCANWVAEELDYGRAFLLLPVFMGFGAALWFVLPNDPFSWLNWAWAPGSALCWLAFRSRRYLIGTVLLIAVQIDLGMALASFDTYRADTQILDQAITTRVTGVVERRDADGEGRWRYLLRVTKTAQPELRRPPSRVTLIVRSKQPAYPSGTEITMLARLSPPSGPALPGLNDFAFSSFFDGSGAVGYAYGRPQVTRTADKGQGLDFVEWLFSVRAAVGDRIRAVVPGDAGAFAAALVTDERRAISPETVENLRVAGLAHIVAISGMNMALAAGIFFVGVRTGLALFPGFAQRYPVKKIAAAGALMMVTAYYAISGFGVSAERAYIMMAIMLGAVLFDKPLISLRNVALSALVILITDPATVIGPSFQMSFAATVALVAGYAAWSDWRGRRSGWSGPRPARSMAFAPLRLIWVLAVSDLTTSLIGGFSTAIFSIDHFHRMTTYGLVANVLAMPPITFIVTPAAVIGMLLMPLGLDAPFLKVMGWGLEFVIDIADMVASWGGDVAVGRQHPWFLGLGTAGFLLLVLLRTPLRLAGLPLIVGAIGLSWQFSRQPMPDLLVSDDGSLVGLVGTQAVATNRTKPANFIFEQWRHALILPPHAPPEVAKVETKTAATKRQKRDQSSEPEEPSDQPKTKKQGVDLKQAVAAFITASDAANPGIFNCVTKVGCFARTDTGVRISWLEDGRMTGTACDLSDIVVVPRAGFHSCRSGALLLSGETLRRTGALELSFNNTTVKQRWHAKAAMLNNDRPWSRHRAYDWRTDAYFRDIPEPVLALLNDSGG
ncbi:ComEC/Rec2 family competence protein [Rhizobium oryzicola]|uniref:ComEC/Rec2 family competence protein n=1 Tax=Rhizobium oryzicola TaxID=1232668 RepID=A0ABT8SZU3_9HYPH|nr:ComEC/Rec2 family competence protein [Rhizobium oryzicola]MDO1583918.1 ComEC/Rec2 family competence protein [Rhizobium oryzicola]